MSGLPAKGNDAYFDLGDFGPVGASLAQIQGWTRHAVEDLYMAQVKASSSWGDASSKLFAGLEAGLAFPIALLKALGERLTGAVIHGVHAIEDVFGAIGAWTEEFLEDVSDSVTKLGELVVGVGGTVIHDVSAAINHATSAVQDTIDGLVQGFLGFLGGGFGAADVSNAAVDVSTSMAALQSAVTDLITKSTNGSNSGVGVLVDFSAFANGSSLGSDFSQDYSGSGTGTFGIANGRALAQPSNGDSRSCVARYNAKVTLTDYQKIGVVYATAPQTDILGHKAYNYIFGRMNAAANDYVYVELGLNSCELGCVVAGTKHAFGTVPGFRFRSGSAYWLECGTTGGGRVFRVWENSTPILTYTDASSVSQLDANHRYSGLGTYAYSNVLYAIVPAQASALAFVDNTPAPTVGSGFRRTRTSTSTANISTTTNTQLPGSWFDSPDRITDDLHYDHGTNKLTVSVAGWYAVTISVLVDDNVGTSFFLCPVLYQNNSVVQLGNTIYYPSGASERARAATTFIVYCAKDDYLEPGYNASQTSSNSLTGEGGGVECYFEAVFINNKKPSA